MQLLANTLNKPIYVAQSDYAPALGACIYAAVAGGFYRNVTEAGKKLGSNIEADYAPNPGQVAHMAEYLVAYESLAHFVETNTTKK
jgi:L-ribulokinase